MTLLIDADILVYKAAAGNQTDINWGDVTSTEVNFFGAQSEIMEKVDTYLQRLGDREPRRGDAVLCFGGEGNFRKGILPTYKGNRADKARPNLLAALRTWCEGFYDCRSEPMLEGDDMLGLLWEPGDIIVSQDKDLKGVPCALYNPNHPDRGVEEIDKTSADHWHLLQALMGDACDGYKGCPGIGPKKAWKILHAAYADLAEDDPAYIWATVVHAYESKGLTEADALVQARVARILRQGDYDFKTKEIKLWSPNAA